MAFLDFLRIAFVSAALFTSVNAACDSPVVRQEWRSITSAERAAWISGIKCLAALPHDPAVVPTVNTTLSIIPPMTANSTYYDDWVYAHMDLNVEIHQTGFFLPWHRLYVHSLESTMRSKCGYTGVHPYWDWTIDAGDFFDATIFSDDATEGLGGWGDPTNDYQITTGGLKDIKLAYPVPHNIRRNFTNVFGTGNFPGAQPLAPLPATVNLTFTEEEVQSILTGFDGNYTGFQETLENLPGPHPGPHIILGGDMSGTCTADSPATCVAGQKWSPNDPMFFLHHAMIDRVWYQWQIRTAGNQAAFEGGSISVQVNASEPVTGGPPELSLDSLIPGDGLWGDVKVSDVLSTTDGILCYTYA